jgi:potassium-transporting ATPase KdpC subunit
MMKQHIFPALRVTLVCSVLFTLIYTVFILAIAQLRPDKGNGQTVRVNGKTVGYALEGQSFTSDKYFWGRPSAVGYNAAGSGGSNKSTSNPDYLQLVSDRLDSFLLHNPGISKLSVPAELITASGSGLDPDLSPEGARVQVKRIAALRRLSEQQLMALVDQQTETPMLGLLGTSTVNVLALNIALDNLH